MVELLSEVKALIYKELLVEWRMRYALNSILLYVCSTVFIIALAFRSQLSPELWITIFWIMNLFIGIQVVAKSFLGESDGQLLYLFQMAHATSIILAKLVYNILLMLLMIALSFSLFSIFLGFPFKFFWQVLGVSLYGGGAIAVALTLVSAIVANTSNKTNLMAVLSFPVLFPQLLFVIRLSNHAYMDTLDYKDALFAVGVSGVLITLSILLFPFLWRN